MQNEVVTPPNAPILVTGATGTLGRVVVRRLRERGDEVRVLSRREGDGFVTGDLASGRGLDAAVDCFRLPGRRFGAYRAGENLVPGEPYGAITFEQFLGATR